MADTIPNIVVPAGTVVDIYANAWVIAAGVVAGDQITVRMIGDGEGKLYAGASLTSEPDDADGFMPIYSGNIITNDEGDLGAFIWSLAGCTIAIIKEESGWGFKNIFPAGLFTGLRAMTTQSYTEANSKLGAEHEGSTYIPSLAGLGVNNTIFLTGAKPVILKARRVSFSGLGVIAEIFESPTYTGGTANVYQNSNAINPITGLTTIIVGSTVTLDGVLKFAPVPLIGSSSQQSKGATSVVAGSEQILKPNTAYLFRITSLDPQIQSVASFLSWYEGVIDLPR